jgi:nicotinamide mononucleotide transporter
LDNITDTLTKISPEEWIGFVFGVWGIILGIKEKLLYYPVSLINVIISLYLFFNQKLYSDAIQQVVYISLLSYGWVRWSKGGRTETKLNVTHASQAVIFRLLLLIAAYTFITGTLFKNYSDASLPYWDALATALSFSAQFLLAEKKIENWLVWIDVNIIYIGIYYYKGLPLYTILFTIYLLLAVFGYFKWLNHVVEQEG